MHNSYVLEFKSVVCRIESSTASFRLLYEKWVDEIPWRESRGGPMVTVGFINERPIVITINHVKLCDQNVIFWEATSELVDYSMIKNWFSQVMPYCTAIYSENFESLFLNEYRDIIHPNQFAVINHDNNPSVLVSEKANSDIIEWLKEVSDPAEPLTLECKTYPYQDKVLAYSINNSGVSRVRYLLENRGMIDVSFSGKNKSARLQSKYL